MDFDFSKKMKEDEKAFDSLEQRDIIYKQYLTPLKVKISQILLYDTEQANILLQKYVNIEKNEDKSIKEIITDITNLEIEIQQYEENKGKEKLFENQSEIILSQLDDLKEKCEELDIKVLKSKFLEIRELYNRNSNNYSYTDRSKIENKISEIQSKLIIKKVKEGATDLHDVISKDDIANLTIIINNTIFTIMQSQNPNIKDRINEIRYKMIHKPNAIYDPEIWRLLDYIQRNPEKLEQIEVDEQKEKNNSNIELQMIPKNNKEFELPNFKTLFNKKTIKIGDRKIRLNKTVKIGNKTINVKKLAEIDIEWLAKQVPQEMLIAIEDEKLKEEGKEKTKKKYIPNRKTPIYNAFNNIYKSSDNLYFYNEEGTRFRIVALWSKSYLESEDGTKLIGNHSRFRVINEANVIINYAELIDKIMNSNLKQQLLNELGIYVQNQILRSDISEYKGIWPEVKNQIKDLPILSNLSISYDKVYDQVFHTCKNFEDIEEQKRNKFYKENQFKEEIKVDKKDQEIKERLMTQQNLEEITK